MTHSARSNKLSVDKFLSICWSNAFLMASSPSLCGIFGYPSEERENHAIFLESRLCLSNMT